MIKLHFYVQGYRSHRLYLNLFNRGIIPRTSAIKHACQKRSKPSFEKHYSVKVSTNGEALLKNKQN